MEMDFGPRYKVGRTLGEGGFGLVVEAFDSVRDQTVAVKTLSRFDPTELVRFKSEFRRFADLSHPNLIRLYDLGTHGGRWFFTMECVHGMSWLDFVAPPMSLSKTAAAVHPHDDTELVDDNATADSLNLDAEVTIERAVDVSRLRSTLRQLCDALVHLHEQGIVHCDIKPSNVLVTDTGRVLVLDFGIATQDGVRASGVTEAERVIGTPAYMSPEQAQSHPLTPASDAYAVGVMLFEALTGRLPFDGNYFMMIVKKATQAAPSAASMCSEADPALAALADQLLALKPEERPTLGAVRTALGEDASNTPMPLPTKSSRALVGREAELGVLHDAAAKSRVGPVLVHVRGPSGFGKSHLVERCLEEMGPEVRVLRGRCFQREHVPYKAFDQLIDDLSRVVRGLSSADRSHVIPRDAALLAPLFPVLARVSEIAGAPRRRGMSTERHEAFAALRELLARLSDLGPLVLVLDDIQWADSDSAQLLAHLLAPPGPPAALVVIVSRDGNEADAFLAAHDDRAARLAGTRERVTIDVGALSPTESVRLAERWLADLQADTNLAEELALAADGVPIFLQKLVSAAANGWLQREGGDARGSVDALILAAHHAQTDGVQDLVELIATSERGLSLGALVELSSLSTSALARVLPDLCRDYVLRVEGANEGRERFRPFHDRVREAILTNMDATEAASKHRLLARYLIAQENVDPHFVFGHARAAGERELTIDWAIRAADVARGALASDRAAALYGEALALLAADDVRYLPTLQRRAEEFEHAHRSREAATAYLAIADYPGVAPAEALRARIRAGEQLISHGANQAGLTVIRPAMRALKVPLPSSLRVAALGWLALRVWLALFSRHAPQARELSEHEKLRRDAAFLTSLVVQLVNLPLGFFLGGWVGRFGTQHGDRLMATAWRTLFRFADVVNGVADPTAAFAEYAKAEAELDASEHGNVLRPHFAWVAAMTKFLGGRMQEAANDLVALARGRARQGHATTFKMSAYYTLAALGWVGRYRELSEMEEEFRTWAAERDDLFLSAMIVGGEGAIAWVVRDRVAEGRVLVEGSLAAWRPDAQVTDITGVYGEWTRALFDAYEGKSTLAADRMRALVAKTTFDPYVAPRNIRTLNEIFAARYALQAWSDEPPAAPKRRRFRSALRRASWLCFPTFRPLLTLIRAGAARVEGDTVECARLLSVAIEECEAREMLAYARMGRHELGLLEGDDAGVQAVAEVQAWLASEEVRDSRRFIGLHLPGLPSSDPRS